jgi:hypothetical protein
LPPCKKYGELLGKELEEISGKGFKTAINLW